MYLHLFKTSLIFFQLPPKSISHTNHLKINPQDCWRTLKKTGQVEFVDRTPEDSERNSTPVDNTFGESEDDSDSDSVSFGN